MGIPPPGTPVDQSPSIHPWVNLPVYTRGFNLSVYPGLIPQGVGYSLPGLIPQGVDNLPGKREKPGTERTSAQRREITVNTRFTVG